MGLDNFLHDRITDEDTFRYTLPEILRMRAEQTPDETAFIFLKDGDDDEERITYKELDHAATAIAHRLIEKDLRGERALMLFPPGLEFVKALYGCFYAGVIAVPAYPPRKNRSLDRIKVLVVDSGASIVLTIDDIYQSFERSFSDLEELRKLEWISTDNPSSPLPLFPVSMPPSPHASMPPHFPMPLDIALLQYTSGSTGQPKGVIETHRNLMRSAEFMRNCFELFRISVSVTWLPCFHDNGLIDGVIVPVYTGFPSVIIPPVTFIQKPICWFKAISKYKATHSGGPNFAFELCAESISEDEKKNISLSSLTGFYSGAEPIRKTTLERFVNAFKDCGFKSNILFPSYGMAETTLIISGSRIGRGPVYLGLSGNALEQNRIVPVSDNVADVRYLVGVGYPWLDTEVRIVNPETFVLCLEDEVGEICVSGSIVTAGYWNKKEETEKTFSARIKDDPLVRYLRTGDLGFLHEGELYISGRLKDLIIIYGRNYYPQDIEYLAESSHPALRANASAAFSVDTEDEEKLVIVAEVERTAIRNLDASAVCEAIRQKIGEELELEVYAIQLLRTASILKTSSGKIQRKACKEGFLAKTLEEVGESVLEKSPVSEDSGSSRAELVMIQAWLIDWIHTQLKIPVERIDMSKHISAFGLSSMKAVRLQQDFLTKYGVNLPPYLFFEKISIGELCGKALAMIKEDGAQG